MLTYRVLRTAAEWDDPALRNVWADRVSSSENVNAIYASPDWFDCLRQAHDPADLALITVCDDHAGTVDVIPVRHRQFSLPFDISGWALYSARFTAVEILGSIPSHTSPTMVRELFESLSSAWPGCHAIYFDVVPVGSAWHAALRALETWHVYGIDGQRPWFLLELPESPEAFLASLGSKSRGTLRRKVKKFGEALGGEARVTRVDRPEDVPRFLESATAVSRVSWQHRVLGPRISTDPSSLRHYENLAQRGLLRAYLLAAGDMPSAFVVGYQYNGVFHYAELAFDESHAAASPGTVLLFLLIQDLCAERRPQLLNFGMGDAEYKRRFGNVTRRDESLLILKPSLRNRTAIAAHRGFRGSVRLMRRLVKGKSRASIKGAATDDERL